MLAKVLAGTVFSMANVEEHASWYCYSSLTQTFSVKRMFCIKMYFFTSYVLIWDENTRERWMWANLSQCWGCARVLAPKRAWSTVWPLARHRRRVQIARSSFSSPGQIRPKTFTTPKFMSGPLLLTPDRYARSHSPDRSKSRVQS